MSRESPSETRRSGGLRDTPHRKVEEAHDTVVVVDCLPVSASMPANTASRQAPDRQRLWPFMAHFIGQSSLASGRMRETAPARSGADLHLRGADDGIRIREPHLGKAFRGKAVACVNSRSARSDRFRERVSDRSRPRFCAACGADVVQARASKSGSGCSAPAEAASKPIDVPRECFDQRLRTGRVTFRREALQDPLAHQA